MAFNYYNPYAAQQQQQYYQPPQQLPQPTIPTLNGKIVDSLETAKAQDVPIGSYGIYPKADMTAIYCKTWSPDGTTRVDIYERKITEEQKINPFDEKLNEISESIKALTKRLDSLKTTTPIVKKKREIEEVDEDE